MKTVKFLGASGEVTGSSYLITGDSEETLLVDLGLFQGSSELEALNFSPLEFDPKTLSGVVVTHAHLDHCGRLPLLIKHGFTGQIYLTDASRDIAHISLLDSAGLMGEHDTREALYTKQDVEETYNKMSPVEYDAPFKIGSFNVTFRNAGHILGSASIEVFDRETQLIIFSGDLGNTPQDLILPTESIKQASTVVMESTYGNSTHPAEDVMNLLQQEINAVEKDNGVLLIPAFSIERTQEVIHKVGELKTAGKIDQELSVFLDSPMAIEITEIFKKYPALYNSQMRHEPDPFDFPNLTLTKTVEESKEILYKPTPKIIIAGSGMMSGGRILHHLKNYAAIPTTRILIVGYQAVGTLGRKIEEGAKQIRVFDEEISINATVTKLDSLSSHADQPKLLEWLKQIQGVKEVFLVHGEDPQRQDLAEQIKSRLHLSKVILPQINQVAEIE